MASMFGPLPPSETEVVKDFLTKSGGQELSYTLGTQYIPSNKSHRWAA